MSQDDFWRSTFHEVILQIRARNWGLRTYQEMSMAHATLTVGVHVKGKGPDFVKALGSRGEP